MSLKAGGLGRRYWRLYWENASWLAKADYPTVVRLCQLWDIWDSLHKRLLVDGDGEAYVETQESTRASRRRQTAPRYRSHYFLNDLIHLMTQMERLEGLLGFNPVDRSRIRIAGGGEDSSLDRWKRDRATRTGSTATPT